MRHSEIKEILNSHGIEAEAITEVQVAKTNKIYRIDDRYLLRLNKAPMEKEITKIRRVEHIPNIPKLKYSGSVQTGSRLVHYVILDFLTGEDLMSALPGLSPEQQLILGEQTSRFLEQLHSIAGESYDIGHYIPTIPNYSGSWQAGHNQYGKKLKEGLLKVQIDLRNQATIEKAFAFIDSNIGCLEHQKGPRLLHNDFHPKNIIVDGERFSGVIDWECSPFGEEDFELSHLVHWCTYPPEPGANLNPFLGSLLKQSPVFNEVPELCMRLSIYQIKHDINQMIWCGAESQNERIARIGEWLDGRVNDLIDIPK